MKKHYLVILAAALFCLALCGCGVKKEDVVNRIFEEKADSFRCDMDTDLDVTMGMGGMSLDMGMGGRCSFDIDTADPAATAIHAVVNFTASAMGSTNAVRGESYVVTEDGQARTYVTDFNTGEWSVSTADTAGQTTLDEATRQRVKDELKNVLMQADMDSKTQTVGSEECYELKLDTDAAVFNNLVDVLWDAVDSSTRAKLREQGFEITSVKSFLPYLHIDATVYASKDSGRIVEMDVDLSKTDTAALLAEAMKSAAPMARAMGVDLSQIKLTLTKTEFSFRFSDYNNVKVEVPEDVREAAEGGAEEEETEAEEEETEAEEEEYAD